KPNRAIDANRLRRLEVPRRVDRESAKYAGFGVGHETNAAARSTAHVAEHEGLMLRREEFSVLAGFHRELANRVRARGVERAGSREHELVVRCPRKPEAERRARDARSGKAPDFGQTGPDIEHDDAGLLEARIRAVGVASETRNRNAMP